MSDTNELYNLLKKCVDHTGLPVMKSNQFIKTTEKYGKKEFRRQLANFITNTKPQYPLKKFDMERVVKVFRKLQKANFADYLSTTSDIMEKYDDYKYPYSKYGLGLISCSPFFNYCSDIHICEF